MLPSKTKVDSYIPIVVCNTILELLENHSNQITLDDILDESDEKIRIVLKPKNRKIDSNKLIAVSYTHIRANETRHI